MGLPLDAGCPVLGISHRPKITTLIPESRVFVKVTRGHFDLADISAYRRSGQTPARQARNRAASVEHFGCAEESLAGEVSSWI